MKLTIKNAIATGFIIGMVASVFVLNSHKAQAGDPKMNICHFNSGKNGYEGIEIPQSSWTTHQGHGDFLYDGPLDKNGKPENKDKAADIWCDNNIPTPTVTPTTTPTATPTSTPTATPTCTPTNTPTPTPTEEPDEYHYVCREYNCVKVKGEGESSCEVDKDCEETTPTPTPTPEETPTPTPEATPSPELRRTESTPDVGISQPNCPTGNCPDTCTIPIDAPLLQGYGKTTPTSVFWKWWASKTGGLEKQWIEYGYEENNYPYNVFIPTEATGFEVGALDPNAKQNWARVCVMKDGCVACSNSLDP